MKCTTVKELFQDTAAYVDQEVTVAGWVRSNRGSKAFGFLVMSDGSCFQTLQIYIMTRWRILRRFQS